MKFNHIDKKKKGPTDLTMEKMLSNGSDFFFASRLIFSLDLVTLSPPPIFFCVRNFSSSFHSGKRVKTIVKPIKKRIIRNVNRTEIFESLFLGKKTKTLKINSHSFSERNIKIWIVEVTEIINQENTVKFFFQVFKSCSTGFFVKKKKRIFFKIKTWETLTQKHTNFIRHFNKTFPLISSNFPFSLKR